MSALEIRKRLEFDAAPQRVWRALTDPDELGELTELLRIKVGAVA